MTGWRGLVPSALLILGALGCEQPPTREIEAAQAQVDAARKEGAEQYAADRWKDAQAAMQQARDRITAKDYRGALSSANAAAERARSAQQAVRSARSLAKGRTETTLEEIRAALEDIDAIRQEAATAKVPEDVFAEFAPRVADAQAGLQRISETLATDALKAQGEATELKSRCADLPTVYRQAQAKWLAEHPTRRPRRKR